MQGAWASVKESAQLVKRGSDYVAGQQEFSWKQGKLSEYQDRMQRSICWIQIKYWAPGSASWSWRFWKCCDKCTDKFKGMSAIAKAWWGLESVQLVGIALLGQAQWNEIEFALVKLHQGWLRVLLGKGGDHFSLKSLEWLHCSPQRSVLFFLLCSFFLTSSSSPDPCPFCGASLQNLSEVGRNRSASGDQSSSAVFWDMGPASAPSTVGIWVCISFPTSHRIFKVGKDRLVQPSTHAH